MCANSWNWVAMDWQHRIVKEAWAKPKTKIGLSYGWNGIKPAAENRWYVPKLEHSTKAWKKVTSFGRDKQWTDVHSSSTARHSLSEKMQMTFNSRKYQVRGVRTRQIKQRSVSCIWNRRRTHACRCVPFPWRWWWSHQSHSWRWCGPFVWRWWRSQFVEENGLKRQGW